MGKGLLLYGSLGVTLALAFSVALASLQPPVTEVLDQQVRGAGKESLSAPPSNRTVFAQEASEEPQALGVRIGYGAILAPYLAGLVVSLTIFLILRRRL